MVKVVVVEKGGNLKEVSIKDNNEALFYKKCSFRNNNNFEKRHTWNVDDMNVSLYAKDNGRAGTENKYDLPPPMDNELFFGKLLLVGHSSNEFDNDSLIDLSDEKWQKCYEKLFGGFESLGEEEESSEDDVDPSMLTKEGYSKEDGFIVDDDEEEEEDDYIPNDEEEDDDGEETDEMIEEDTDDVIDDDDDDDEEEEEDEDDEEEECFTDDSGNMSELSEDDYLSD